MSVPWDRRMVEIQAKFYQGVAGLYRTKGFDKHVSEAPRRSSIRDQDSSINNIDLQQ